jgi:hypothetical protein
MANADLKLAIGLDRPKLHLHDSELIHCKRTYTEERARVAAAPDACGALQVLLLNPALLLAQIDPVVINATSQELVPDLYTG